MSHRIDTQQAVFAAHSTPLPVLHRFDNAAGVRFYFEPAQPPERPEIIVYPGVTPVADYAWSSPHLAKWKMRNGEEGEQYAQERAHYGTIGHILFAKLCIERKLDPSAITSEVSRYLFNEGVTLAPGIAETWVDDQAQDALSVGAWILEREAEAILIEQKLRSVSLKVASSVDWFGTITWNKKRVMAVVDFKTNRSGSFGLDKTIQLMFYDAFIRENFPQWRGSEILLFNLAPKDWRESPSYHFVNHANTVKGLLADFESTREAFGLSQNVSLLQQISAQYHALKFKEQNPFRKSVMRLKQAIDLSSQEAFNASYEVKTIADILKEESYA